MMAASLYQVGFAGAVDQTPHFAQTCSGCLSSNTGDHSEDASSGAQPTRRYRASIGSHVCLLQACILPILPCLLTSCHLFAKHLLSACSICQAVF